MQIRPRNYSTAWAPRAVAGIPVGSLTFNASHFTYTPNSSRAPRSRISQPTNRAPHTVHHTPDTAHHAPRAAHQRNNCPSRSGTTRPYRTMSHVIPHGHFSTTPQNVAIPTLEIQSLKYPRGNYVRHSWRARRQAGPAAPHDARLRPAASRPSGTKTGSPESEGTVTGG